VDQGDAVPSEIHQWDGYLHVGVRRPATDTKVLAETKQESTRQLVDTVFPSWRGSTTKFSDDVIAELDAAGDQYMHAYADLLVRLRSPDPLAYLTGPVAGSVVESMVVSLTSAGTEAKNAIAICQSYFRSSHFRRVPYHDLTARMHASLKRQVKNGAFRDRQLAIDRLSGFFFDVEHVATYAPYSDAIFLDNAMAELLAQACNAVRGRYSFRVFSSRTMTQFADWLLQLEAEIPSGHLDALAMAYPHQNWRLQE
jgi:hypothetical protein